MEDLRTTETADVPLLQLPGRGAAGEEVATGLFEEDVEGADGLVLVGGGGELVPIQAAVEPKGPVVGGEVEELQGTDGVQGPVGGLYGGVVEIFFSFFRVGHGAHGTRVAIVKGVFGVAHQLPADPEGFFVA